MVEQSPYYVAARRMLWLAEFIEHDANSIAHYADEVRAIEAMSDPVRPLPNETRPPFHVEAAERLIDGAEREIAALVDVRVAVSALEPRNDETADAIANATAALALAEFHIERGHTVASRLAEDRDPHWSLHLHMGYSRAVRFAVPIMEAAAGALLHESTLVYPDGTEQAVMRLPSEGASPQQMGHWKVYGDAEWRAYVKGSIEATAHQLREKARNAVHLRELVAKELEKRGIGPKFGKSEPFSPESLRRYLDHLTSKWFAKGDAQS